MLVRDGLRRKLALRTEVLKVGIDEPDVWRNHWFGFGRPPDFGFGEIGEEVLERKPRVTFRRVLRAHCANRGVIDVEERIDQRLGKLCAIGEPTINQKAIELATLAKNASADRVRVSLRFEISGEAVKMRTERAAPEVNERAFFFIPVFEHKTA